MPDHFHALLEGTTDGSDLRECVRQFKQRSSCAWKHAHGTALWQRGYWERVLRSDEHTITVARYILDNPVRARLVKAPEAYPFSGSLTMSVRDLLQSM